MLTKVRYSPKDIILWTRVETTLFLLYALLVTVLFEVFDLRFLNLPWAPIAVLGTAVAFIVGFQNNAAYGRIWEARKIWGGVVNASRSFAMKVNDMVTGQHAKAPVTSDELAKIKAAIIHRHVGWLTALRHAMRQPRPWEELEKHKTNREWSQGIYTPERLATLEEDLCTVLSQAEWKIVQTRTNKAAAVLFLQSNHLRELKERGLIWEFAFLELENVLQELFALQGKSERIKNFPYPRQYATLSYQFVLIFIALLPFAAIPEFASLAEKLSATWPLVAKYFVWVGVPFCALISWVFHTMERIGRVGENPFEGSPNDVPISTICRGIEVDLRQLLEEEPEAMPPPLPVVCDVQM